MPRDMNCTQVLELAPELALDIAVGEERAMAIRHLDTCQECRRAVADLSTMGDDLLMLAPEAEPPRGLGDRVLAALNPPRRRQRRWVVALAAAAAIVVAAALGAGAVLGATSSDRQLAADYRTLLDRAGGSSFIVAPLERPDGRIGTVFVYAGNPSWIYATVEQRIEPLRVVVQLVMRNGSVVGLGPALIGGGQAAWGSALPVDAGKVHAVRFIAADGSGVFEARLDSNAAVRAGWPD